MIFGRHINRYYLKYSPVLLLGILSLIFVDIYQLRMPHLYQLVVNGINDGFVVEEGVQYTFDMQFLLDKICMPLLLIIVIMLVGRFLWRICFLGSAVRVEAALRERMFDNARHLSHQYYQANKVGNLMSLFTNDLDTVQECFGWGIMMLFDASFTGVLAIGKMWRMDRTLTLLSLIPMLFLMGAATVLGRYMMKKWDIRQEAFSKLTDFAQESFTGLAVIKAFVKEGKELWAFKKLNIENEKANMDHTRASVLFRILVMLFVESVICVILGYGGFLVYQDRFNAGQLVEFIGYFEAVIWPVMAVSEMIDMGSRGRASLLRISELLDAKQDVVDQPDAQELINPKGKIEFRGLNFRYPDGDIDALEDISFTIEAGENVGLFGRTGSGKTTLVDLILRTYNVPDGTLFIDDQDVNTLTIRSVREACSYVPQDNFLFSDTIEHNISFGMATEDPAAVVQAARLADIHSNIEEFRAGYNTVLGERGVTVSGGQKQRISIARALMRNAPILILDDSVSAVDTKTERNILNNLHETRAGMTTILIAHRVSTIEKMDKVVFIDEGRVDAVGTHQELYATNRKYQKMVDLQKLDEEGGEGNA